MNTLSPDLADDLTRVIERIETDPAVRAVVIGSAKEDNFLAGADVRWLKGVDDPEEVLEVLRNAHEGFARLERVHSRLGKPVVAAISGPCLGGGLELALACSMRVASDDPKTQLGQPEIQLGLIPAVGGTQRLPRLVGLAAALDMILTGRPVRPGKARALGLVDKLCPPEELLEVAGRLAMNAANRGPRKQRLTDRLRELASPAALQRLALETTAAGRRLVYRRAEQQMLRQTKGRYPAPPAALRAVRAGLEEGFERGSQVELEEFARLVVSPEAKALISIFLTSRELKKDTGITTDVPARAVQRVGILGGGLMGGGIAAVTVDKVGLPVRINEVDQAGVDRGLGYVRKVLDRRVERHRLTPEAAAEKMSLASGTTDYAGFNDVDLVIEAVFEDLDLKHRVLREAEAATGPETIFASNTSSLPIGDIAAAAGRPELVIGMHYFSPVEKMPLLEVIVAPETADWVTATCVAFGKQQDKSVIVVNDGTGFYTTRILSPYLNEAGFLIEEGVGVEEIDKAMENWGFPVGPLQLADEVGIDVGAKIGTIMVEAFGDRMRPPAGFAALIADDRKGRKNQRGFYRYDKGKRTGVDETVYGVVGTPPRHHLPDTQIQDRLSLAMVNEAVLCLEEGILRSARDGDIGAVFGLGFPAYTGGPFTLIDRMGAKDVVNRLEELAAAHGERFAPARLLVERAESGEKFRS